MRRISGKRLDFPSVKLTLKLGYQVSKMANYASKAKHGSSSSMWSYSQGQTPRHLKIASWNVNGFRSIVKKGLLQSYLRDHDPDILCINETKMDLEAFSKEKASLAKQLEGTFPTESLTRWHWYWNFCKVSSGYSGVMTLSKFQPITSFEQFPLNHHLSLQGRCLTMQFANFFLINCYKPNSGVNLDRLEERTLIYDPEFTGFVKKLKETKPVIICGDMNVAHKEIDIARPKSNLKTAGFTQQERMAFSELLGSAGLVDSFRMVHPQKIEYTWWSNRGRARENNIGWRIDYILTTEVKIVESASVHSWVMGSDHCPIECMVKL